MEQAIGAVPRDAAFKRHYHPLEIIPFFRRFPCGLGRDILYTFIWNVAFGLVFYVMSGLFRGRMPPLSTLPLNVLVANFIG